MIVQEIKVEFHATPEELEFLESECARMDREEPIVQPWTVQNVLATWLQMEVDRRRGDK